MINIVTALKTEALEIIKYFKLKNKNGIYQNGSVNLTVTGQGKIKSAINTSILLCRYPYPVINIGICGSNRHEINKGFYIHKITDSDSGLEYYPDFFKKESEEIFTVSKLGKYYPMVDMESSGFFEAAYRFLNVDDIALYKIVSDTPEQKPKNIPSLIYHHIKIIEDFIETKSGKKDFYSNIENYLNEIKNKIPLTQTQLNQLRHILILKKIKNQDFPPIKEIKNKKEVKEFITSLFSSLEI